MPAVVLWVCEATAAPPSPSITRHNNNCSLKVRTHSCEQKWLEAGGSRASQPRARGGCVKEEERIVLLCCCFLAAVHSAPRRHPPAPASDRRHPSAPGASSRQALIVSPPRPQPVHPAPAVVFPAANNHRRSHTGPPGTEEEADSTAAPRAGGAAALAAPIASCSFGCGNAQRDNAKRRGARQVVVFLQTNPAAGRQAREAAPKQPGRPPSQEHRKRGALTSESKRRTSHTSLPPRRPAGALHPGGSPRGLSPSRRPVRPAAWRQRAVSCECEWRRGGGGAETLVWQAGAFLSAPRFRSCCIAPRQTRQSANAPNPPIHPRALADVIRITHASAALMRNFVWKVTLGHSHTPGITSGPSFCIDSTPLTASSLQPEAPVTIASPRSGRWPLGSG